MTDKLRLVADNTRSWEWESGERPNRQRGQSILAAQRRSVSGLAPMLLSDEVRPATEARSLMLAGDIKRLWVQPTMWPPREWAADGPSIKVDRKLSMAMWPDRRL